MTDEQHPTLPAEPTEERHPAPLLWIKVPEAARRLGVGEKAVRSGCNRGEIAHRWVGKNLLIFAPDLEKPPPVRPRHRRRIR